LNGLKRHLNELLLAIDDDIAQYSSISDFNYKRNLIRAAVCELCDNPDQSIEGPEVPVEPLQLYSEWSHDDAGPSEYAESEAYVTGEALYFNDINTEGVLHGAVVLSTEAHAKILKVDTTEAMSLDGVVKYVDIHQTSFEIIQDIPRGGTNYPGSLLRDIFGPDDTPMFADGEVSTQFVLAFGQLIGLVVARDPVTARRAATLVKVHYQELPAVLTMEVSSILGESYHENWVIHTTTQSMNLHQLFTAAVLGVPAQNVTVKVKHVGGSFGGKYTQSALTGAWAAVAAYALNRPVKVRLTRFEDMFVTGKRHPAMVKYKVGVSTSGLLRCAYLKVYLDGGYAVDTSHVVAYLSTALSDTCYNIPVMRAEGYALKTNKSNNTAMRANGMPQAFFAMNGTSCTDKDTTAVVHLTTYVTVTFAIKIMEMNFNKGGGVRLSGEPIPNDALLECWNECLEFSEFDRIRKDVNRFNATSKNVKLGIALSATRMGLAHPGANEQAEALVQICMDGSVEIKIGGIEMGQGLNTKCIQIASRTLGIPISLIKIVDASTDNTCNDPAAGGSQDATAHGRAVQACCERLMVGLRAILKEEPDWCKAVQKAHNMRLPLKASEHTRIDREKHGIPLQSSVYNTTGVACIVSQILSVDIVMDAGRSLNPAVDIGQIEGALMMSYGNFTCEELTYDDKGKMSDDMFSRYKFPSSLMTPKRFRVKLLKRSDGSEGQIYSSKSVGDPATVLGVGIYASLRYAINARRQDIGRTKCLFRPSFQMKTSDLRFNVNGNDVCAANIDPETTLASYLRNTLGLTGTKLACEEGVCGACTVVIGKWDYKAKKARRYDYRYIAVNACLFPLYMVHNHLVLTVEGIGNTKKIHPIQDRLARGHGTQCGFCSPGFVMSAYALLRTNPTPSIHQINQAVKGEAWFRIGICAVVLDIDLFLKLFIRLVKDSSSCPCKENGMIAGQSKLVTFGDFPKFDETQEIIFPPTLIMGKTTDDLYLEGDRVTLVTPTSWKQFDDCIKMDDKVTLVSSGMISRLMRCTHILLYNLITSAIESHVPPLPLGVWVTSWDPLWFVIINEASEEKYDWKFLQLLSELAQSPKQQRTKWVSLHKLPSLKAVEVTEGGVSIGAALSVSDFVRSVEEFCDPSISTPIRNLFEKYSSTQVMNVASWVGGLFTGASDISSVLLAFNAKLVVRELASAFTSGQVSDFMDDQYHMKLKSGDVVVAVVFPRSQKNVRVFTFKQGQRTGADTTVVNCVGVLRRKDNIENARVALSFGSGTVLCNKVNECLSGKRFDGLVGNNDELLKALDEDIAQFSSIPDFSYRRALAKAAISKMCEELSGKATVQKEIPVDYLQLYTEWSKGDSDACGRPLATQSSDRYTTGEAVFVNDMKIKDVVHASVVLSTKAHAKILSVDASEALSMNGVLRYIDINSIPKGGTNYPGMLPVNVLGPDNTPMFADGEVLAVGQVIGLVIAEDLETARRAAKLVKVCYEELPAILTMDEAIEQGSYHAEPLLLGVEEEVVRNELRDCEFEIEGTTTTGGQEHCYMETQGSIAVPGENDEWVIHSSTQSMNMVQLYTSAVLSIPANKVTVRVKRIGGAFGGKASQSLPPGVWAAVAAHAVKRPVSVMLTRNEDMLITGKRHPIMVKYRVGLDRDGTLRAAYLKVYVDGGYASDVSHMVTWLSSEMADCCYNFPVMRVEGYTLKTNKSNNTAFRGFGVPQAFFAMNGILSHAASSICKPLEEIMEKNFKKSGEIRFSKEPILNDALLDCWKECMQWSDFKKRREEVDSFNKKSEHIKRGIAMAATRMGLTHPGPLEQAAALVQIYMDGTVAVSIGGVEMGQGLNTKCMQVASRALGIPISLITILDASTDKTCNAPDTGGSQAADIHGKAIQVCCERLLTGLRPILKEEPDWKKAVLKAYNMKLPLQASEHIRIEREKYGIAEHSSTYQTSGAACIVSEVDCRTGEHQLLSVDIVMDVGRSLNPAVDIGQIEGAFMQSYGNFTCEELTYDDKGKLVEDSLYKYKLPTPAMTPKKYVSILMNVLLLCRFRVKLLKESDCFEGQVYSSKGIGEPPMMLGVGTYASLRYAIRSRRADLRIPGFFPATAPLTAAKIVSYCNYEDC
uniref:Ald_Xan_dh_C domain-containing protein n=1 Tax=Haemonchus placei TaxID=6290 RepID=A0A158QP00_HAEPC